MLDEVLREWERWAAELLESQISYPVLTFFRSQHSNQSWLAALTTMLDVTSLVLTGIEGVHPGQAKLTFAMARHAAVDLAQVVNARYDPAAPERLSDEEFGGGARGSGLRDCDCAMTITRGINWRSCDRCTNRTYIRRAQFDADAAGMAASGEAARQLAGGAPGIG